MASVLLSIYGPKSRCVRVRFERRVPVSGWLSVVLLTSCPSPELPGEVRGRSAVLVETPVHGALLLDEVV